MSEASGHSRPSADFSGKEGPLGLDQQGRSTNANCKMTCSLLGKLQQAQTHLRPSPSYKRPAKGRVQVTMHAACTWLSTVQLMRALCTPATHEEPPSPKGAPATTG